MMIMLTGNSNNKRGTMLATALFLIPAAALVMMLLLSRLEVAYGESQRHEARAQARALAESALAVLQNEPPASAIAKLKTTPIEGKIEGAGRYRASLASAPAHGERIQAQGIVEHRAGRFICEIEATPTTNSIQLLDIRQRLELASLVTTQ